MQNKIVIGAIIAVVIAVFAFGIIDPETAFGWARNIFYRAKAPMSQLGKGGSPGNVDHARTCRQTLDRIEAAKRKSAFDRGQSVGSVTWEDVIRAMNLAPGHSRLTQQQINDLIPKCPDGGTYTLGTLQEVPRCSIGGNNSLSTDDDHVIRT
jgi:hypothetical protein